MGTGTYDSYWGQPRSAQNVRELEQMASNEFDPPLSSQELLEALRACNYRTQDAYMYLQASRRRIPASAPAAPTSIYMMQRTPERVREKRRFSSSPASEKDTPSKRHKDQNSMLVAMTDEKDGEDVYRRVIIGVYSGAAYTTCNYLGYTVLSYRVVLFWERAL